jgi:hypothetical protein
LVLVAVNAILVTLVPFGLFSISVGEDFSYSAYGFSAAIFMLVAGILFVRQTVRLCAQMGTGRKTAFLSLFPSGVIAALGIALVGELLLIGAQYLFRDYVNVYFNDLYAILYVGFEEHLTPLQHGISALFSACLMLACYGFGLFCSALFWRLNKIGCVIAGILMGATFLFGLPFVSLQFTSEMEMLMNFCFASPWNCMGTFLVIFLFFSIIAWFLVRNVNIRGISK